ncbi:MAG: 16S rRNA (adenine(1518)-N(6)/adenine(1519)-N(6))-dimethyltransferase RsmA [Puniceicoccales bacterium]|jgi:16S rRNA (adenine1518-N6/adenine1519-N6)-dimethyltransferase|nr:16S rRNA (adenine(1518)-N(6)/adenine(1519)-N(6))-dimethyltransferase RsmA [Puniceicoccales bacterium]
MAINPLFEPLSPKQTRALLDSLAKIPQKKWGQNFLVDKNIVFKSVELAQLRAGENVVEIGPGLGTLTRAMLAKNCCVFAVEYDPLLCAFLQKTFDDIPTFRIIRGDAVAQPLAGFSQGAPCKIVANLPYNISTPWIDAVLKQPRLPTSMTLMVQRETASRFLAQPGSKKCSAISIFLHATYRCETIFPVSRSSFSPAPGVDSAIIHLQRLPAPKIFHPETRALMRKFFTQRRKQMGALLRVFLPECSENVAALLQKNGLAITARPEQLPLQFWHDFDNLLNIIYNQ